MKRIMMICLALLCTGAVLEAETYKGKIELGLQGGGIFFEGNSGIDEDFAYGGRVGYYLSDCWAVEVDVLAAQTEIEQTKFSTDVLAPWLEAQYHFGTGKMRPFLSLGGGDLRLDPEGAVAAAGLNYKAQDDFVAVYGGGFKWLFHPHWIARLDARGFLNTEIGRAKNDGAATIGISYLFGGAEEVKKAVASAKQALDSDGDGVLDDADTCPNTPAGTAVNSSGCPQDSDGDGVPDAQDTCPGTTPGIAVTANGCPGDTDADGVTNDLDKCPGTPTGMKVDAAGCPESAKIPETNEWVLKGVTFEANSDKVKSESLPVLDEAANILLANPTVRIEIGGHTDSAGRAETSQPLSERRAQSVKNYLVGKGVPADRMQAKGYGHSVPIADNKTAEGRAQNRRIEFKVLSR